MIRTFLNRIITTVHTQVRDYTDSKIRKKFHPLGRVPNVGSRVSQRVNTKINRYLYFQEKRLYRLKEKNSYDAIVLIVCILLKNSLSYQITLFNRTCKGWYWMYSKDEVKSELKNIIKRLRKGNLNLYLNRFYVIKSKTDKERNGMLYTGQKYENEKLRPIGSPDRASSMISKSITNLVTFIFDDRPSCQHGYKPEMGVYSALMDIVKRHQENPNAFIMEFDFTSYFNKVSMNWVRWKLEEKSKILSDLVGELIIKLTYNFKELEKESELHFYGFKNVKGKMKPLIVRGGMPQGLSMSPLLSTLAMEFIPPHPGLCMYADDGLFFSDDPEEFYFFMDSLGGYGISVAEDKTKLVDKTKDIKFLGCNINFEKEYIEYEGKSIKFSDKNLEKFLKTVSSQYCKKKYRWEWDIKEGSFILNNLVNWKDIPIYDLARTWMGFIWDWSSYKGKYYYPEYGFIDVLASSSNCITELLKELESLSLGKKKRLKISMFNELPKVEVNKGNYLETFYDVEVFEGTNNFSEHIEMVDMLMSREK